MITPPDEIGKRLGGQNGFISVLPPRLLNLWVAPWSRSMEHIRRTYDYSQFGTVEEKIEAVVERIWTALGVCFLHAEGKSPLLSFLARALLVPRLMR